MTSNHPAPRNVLSSPVAMANGAAAGVRLKSEELFAGAREIAVLHNGREYRLRITQQNKLLLTA